MDLCIYVILLFSNLNAIYIHTTYHLYNNYEFSTALFHYRILIKKVHVCLFFRKTIPFYCCSKVLRYCNDCFIFGSSHKKNFKFNSLVEHNSAFFLCSYLMDLKMHWIKIKSGIKLLNKNLI